MRERLRVVTWNIDGLSREDAEARSLGVLRVLLAEQADVVLLQEVTAPWFHAALRPVLGHAGYAAVPGEGIGPSEGYGCVAFSRLPVRSWSRRPLPRTMMGRSLLRLEVDWGGEAGLVLLTGHLESLSDGSAARRVQLAAVMAEVRGAEAEGAAVLFGGDTNLREAEVSAEAAARDAWRLAGEPASARYTWDLVRNANKVMPGGGRPRARYDRVFVGGGLRVEGLGLVGEAPLERAGGGGGRGLWASDHFGVRVEVCREAAGDLDRSP